jgi:hypothetical protein
LPPAAAGAPTFSGWVMLWFVPVRGMDADSQGFCVCWRTDFFSSRHTGQQGPNFRHGLRSKEPY